LDSINDIQKVSFTGGEPILHSRFKEIIKETIKRKLEFSVISNGFFYKKYAFLSKSDFFKKISFSLNGDKEIHDNIRGLGSFDKVIKAIKYYVPKKVAVNVIYVVAKQGYNEVERIIKLLKELNVNQVSLGAVIKNGSNDSFTLDMEQRKKLYWNINKYITKYNININPTLSLFSLGGVENCGVYGDRSQIFISAKGELLYCCNIHGNPNRLGKISEKNINKLIKKRDILSTKIRDNRSFRILTNNLKDEMEYTCEYCNKFFRD
jgi:MoaA/NifB/PqqE/SkfB family radical SAM enzyme